MSRTGAVAGPRSLDLKARLALALYSWWPEEKRLLAHILAEYDHAHNPEKWNTIRPHPRPSEIYILNWTDHLFPRNPQLVQGLIQEWNRLPDDNSRADSCSVGGIISEMLYQEVLHFLFM